MENLKNKADIKVLISDYDFTFYTGEEEIKENIKNEVSSVRELIEIINK